jgi:hypothetical protein
MIKKGDSKTPYEYIRTEVWSSGDVDQELRYSVHGVASMDVYVNGEKLPDEIIQKSERLGLDWHTMPIKLVDGSNTVESVMRDSA